MDDDKNVSRKTSFAQRKPRKAQQLAWIRCWNCNENMTTIRVIVPKRRRCMEHNCQKSKKMRMRKGLQVLDPDKMGLQVLDPSQGCNGQVRPRVVLHGNENHECSNSAFFQWKNRKSVFAVCAIQLNRQTDRVIRTVTITI
jgi:NAD-dependent SIR2 family protein deacetylase